MRSYLWALVLLILVSAGAVYHLKHAVWEAERELARMEAAIADETWRVQRLRTDLAYLTRPEWLASLAPKVGMRPATVGRVIVAAQIGRRRAVELARSPVPVELPSGERVELRFKPVARFTIDIGDDD